MCKTKNEYMLECGRLEKRPATLTRIGNKMSREIDWMVINGATRKSLEDAGAISGVWSKAVRDA